MEVKEKESPGASVAQSVRQLALGFGLGRDLRVVISVSLDGAPIRLSAQSA